MSRNPQTRRRLPAAKALLCATWLVLPILLSAAEALPPAPTKYFNDYAGLASAQTASDLNGKLEDFERRTSNQVVVAIFPKVPDGYVMEDFTQRTFQAWSVGQKKTNNGVVLFVFPQSRKLRIEVGYGLEGVLPDITAKQIIENEITPAFKAKNFDLGLSNGVSAILQATQGEYQGTGGTVADRSGANPNSDDRTINIPLPRGWISPYVAAVLEFMVPWFFIVAFVGVSIVGNLRWTSYGPKGKRRGGWFTFTGGGGSSSRSSSSSSGGFSGGGGSSGGGGASGSW